MKISKYLICAMVPAIAGCSSILEGTTQTISVDTSPDKARCEFEREGQVIGVVDPTPGSIFLKKTKHNINLSCRKEGYEEARTFIKSEIQGATFGNIILGGGIGWAIDSASGADNKYQDHISVTLSPELAGALSTPGERQLAALVAPKTSPIWRTVNENVLGYAGARGTGTSILVSPSVELRLVRRDNDWGQFTYEGLNSRLAEVWIENAKVRRE